MKIISLNKKIIKKAYSDNDLSDLLNLPTYNTLDNYEAVKNKLLSIRIVLGKIIATLNTFSGTYKNFLEGRFSNNSSSQNLLNDLKNLDAIKEKCSEIKRTYVESVRNSPSQFKDTYYFSKKNENLLRIIENQISYINSVNFNEKQMENILHMKNGNNIYQRREGLDENKLHQFLGSSIYTEDKKSSETIKAIREILQNACDAVNKKQKTGGIIKIYTSEVSKDNMDLIVEDNGIGMDWKTLSENFFIPFESGKGDDPEATGGFGVAKVKIQNTPKEGWAIDTNDIHSSKFHKNMYLADSSNYQHPKLEGSPIGGVKLTLYSLPIAYDFEIASLVQKYTSLSTLSIYVNDELIKPLFTLDSLKKIDGTNNSSTIANAIGENPTEKNMIENELNSLLKDRIGSLHFKSNNPSSNKETNIDFYLSAIKENKHRLGNCYVYLNGQYQFEMLNSNSGMYIQRFDVICSVQTSARPSDSEYPVDPGRENLKEPYKTPCLTTVLKLKESTEKIFEDELFKDGMVLEIYNQDKGGIKFEESPDDEYKLSKLERALSQTINESAYKKQHPSSNEYNPQDYNRYQDNISESTKEDAIEKIIDQVKEIKGGEEINQSQREMIGNAVTKMMGEKEKNVDIKQIAKEIIAGFESQHAIIIQKEYISKESLQNKKHLIANLTVVWNNVLKIIGEKVMKSNYRYDLSGKKIVAGVVFSRDCLGLSIPPRKNRDSYLTLINPINSAAIIETEMYQNQILESDVKDAHEWIKDETPINKFTNFIYHLATHELCHAISPSSGNLENWHSTITIVEILCQSEYEKVREVVKENMQNLRKDMKQLITVIKKERAKNAKTASKKNVFNLKKNSSK